MLEGWRRPSLQYVGLAGINRHSLASSLVARQMIRRFHPPCPKTSYSERTRRPLARSQMSHRVFLAEWSRSHAAVASKYGTAARRAKRPRDLVTLVRLILVFGDRTDQPEPLGRKHGTGRMARAAASLATNAVTMGDHHR